MTGLKKNVFTMNKLITLKFLFFIVLTPLNILGQNDNLKPVFEANELHFYGYDFTNFKLVGEKRVGEGFRVKPLFFQIIHFMNGRSPESDFERWFEKDNVFFHQDVTKKLNSKIEDAYIVDDNQTGQSHHIPKEKLQGMINRYDIQESKGIGCVHIIGCFNEDLGETNAWFVFFDLSTKKIIDAHESIRLDAGSEKGVEENNLIEYDFGGMGWSRRWGSTISYVHSIYMQDYYNTNYKVFKKRK